MVPETQDRPKRRYEKRRRAEQEQQTRAAIIQAAIDLHGSLGPARTTISAIAARAGVRRATVYRHFPDERALFQGCSGAFNERNPLPDPAAWVGEPDPAVRLERALVAVYAWYERVEPMLSLVLRDAEVMPLVAEVQADQRAWLAAVEDGLARGWGARGRAALRLRAALGLALDFHAWRTLHRRGLSRAEAAALTTGVVAATAGRERVAG